MDIAWCLLDAGCAYIVIPVDDVAVSNYEEEKLNSNNYGYDHDEDGDDDDNDDDDLMNSNSNNLDMALDACNLTLVPRERLILHYSSTTSLDDGYVILKILLGLYHYSLPWLMLILLHRQ